MSAVKTERLGTRVSAYLLALMLAFFACGCMNASSDEGDAPDPASAQSADEESANSGESPSGNGDASEASEATASSSDTKGGHASGNASESAKSENGSGANNPESPSSQDGVNPPPATIEDFTDEPAIAEDGAYTTKDEVAAYIHEFGHLPSNYISKTKAKKAGWVASEGNLDEVCPGKSIGGSQFYNDDGLLPDKSGRTWTECDINYHGGYRGPERIVFSNDGLIYYTGDHYSTFEQLY